jgi:putative transposase
MPRQSRLIVPQVAVHIIQRGNNRNACFRGESDYLVYLLHLRDLSATLDCSVHAYCLMTNHVHLLVTPASREACISLMRNLGQRYVQYFNRRHLRTGTPWEGRFRSCVAESARYVLACYRYIELNPVRAGIVSRPTDYAWSSHAVNIGMRSDTLTSPIPSSWHWAAMLRRSARLMRLCSTRT